MGKIRRAAAFAAAGIALGTAAGNYQVNAERKAISRGDYNSLITAIESARTSDPFETQAQYRARHMINGAVYGGLTGLGIGVASALIPRRKKNYHV